jgi:hypothetical protein
MLTIMLSICGFRINQRTEGRTPLMGATTPHKHEYRQTCGILKVKNAFVKSTYYIKEHICILIAFCGYKTRIAFFVAVPIWCMPSVQPLSKLSQQTTTTTIPDTNGTKYYVKMFPSFFPVLRTRLTRKIATAYPSSHTQASINPLKTKRICFI